MKPLHEQYATALFEVSQQRGAEDIILFQMKEVRALLEQNPEYVNILSAPENPVEERLALISDAFSGADEYLLNFLKILTENKCIDEFSKCTDYFSSLYDREKEILRAKAITALPLDEKQKTALCEKLGKKTGKKVYLTNEIRKSLIGGIVLEWDGEQIDKSLRSALNTIGNLISDSDI